VNVTQNRKATRIKWFCWGI